MYNCYSCIIVSIPVFFVLFIVPYLFFELPQHTSQYTAESWTGTSSSGNDGSILLSQLHGTKVVNKNYDMCKNPYEHVCSVETTSIPELVAESNTALLNSIIDQYEVDTNFVQRCFEFHDLNVDRQMQRILESNVFKDMIHDVDMIKSIDDVWKTFGILQRKGIRQPLHLNKLISGAYQLDQPRIFTVDQTQIHKMLTIMG